MRRTIVSAALLGVATLAMGSVWAVNRHGGTAATQHRFSDDDRSPAPGIHRAGPTELAVRNRVAREESLKLAARARDRRLHAKNALPSVPATTWVNLGPTDAPKEFNYYTIAGVDSGRPNSIVVDPRDPNVVYMAVSGGGVWKTFDFLSDKGPTWAPTMDTLPNLAVGALAVDPDHPDTLYVGNGDFSDASGNTIMKTTDGGGTWGDPVVLSGTYPDPNNVAASVRSIRSISARGDTVFAATDVGLFRSSDGGASFSLVVLPSTDDKIVAASMWSIVPLGGGAWAASGVTACDVGAPPPGIYYASDIDPQACPYGNNAALWHSDDGATWTRVTTTPPTAGTGRITIAAGVSLDPTKTVVYAFVGSFSGSIPPTITNHTVGYWRSDDGGQTYVDATGTLANPDTGGDCLDIDIGHGQSWYNQAIVVDPTNPDNVLVGGNLCGMRTLNGTAAAPTWELVSHWLPSADPNDQYGTTANGTLPYVHADWHTATSVVFQGKVRTFAGTDGGIFSSDDVFAKDTPAEMVTWANHNHGLATHLMYSLASGDPVTGDPFVLFSGLQDNGTRFRADPADPSAFNQPIGGDGIGAVVHHSTSGTTYYGSVEYSRAFCKPAEVDCSVETPESDDVTVPSHWHGMASPLGPSMQPEAIEARMRARDRISGEDSEPFLEHYSDVETDTAGQSVLTHTDEQVFVTVPSGDGFTLVPISQDLTNDPNGGGFSNVTASRTIAGLYGAPGAVSREPFWVTTQGNTMVDWTVAQPVHPDGTGNRLLGATSIDFPPVTPNGKQPGDVFIGAFTGPMNDAMRTPPPDAKGHLWRTTDHGQTWTSIVGADPAHRLPNVPVYVVKYDPVTPTTIYAGTELGVYLSLDDGATWDRMGDNFPIIPVRDMYVAQNQDFIRVATYGRGLWEIYPSAAANHGSPGNGDYDRNLRIDWVDVAAMASRLGETPAMTTAPFYSWIMDITETGSDPPVQSIDDADLAALLTKFGGHP